MEKIEDISISSFKFSVFFQIFLCEKVTKLHLYSPSWQKNYLRTEVKTGRFQLGIKKTFLKSKTIQTRNEPFRRWWDDASGPFYSWHSWNSLCMSLPVIDTWLGLISQQPHELNSIVSLLQKSFREIQYDVQGRLLGKWLNQVLGPGLIASEGPGLPHVSLSGLLPWVSWTFACSAGPSGSVHTRFRLDWQAWYF